MPDRTATVGDAPLERYTIERELGRGGMATVYLAVDRQLSRRVALKILHPDLGATLGPERFAREIRLVARLTHPHILPLHDSGEAGSRLYYVMPYVEGESLRQRLEREPQLPVAEAVRIVVAIAAALDHAHQAGVVHRDIKPENVLLARDPEGGPARPLVTDFGIAKAVDGAGERLTATGLSLGTPAYMSPEQAEGTARVDGRSDVYALGCVAYEMLAGGPPFTGPTAQAILARHAVDPVPPLRTVRPAVPGAVARAIERALAKVPADRFATAGEFAQALQQPAHEPHAAGSARWIRRLLPVAGPAVLGIAYLVARSDGREPVLARATAPPASSIAVFYFEDQSERGDLAHLAAGLTEDLIDQLARVNALRVISPNGVRRFRGRDVAPDSVAEALGVGTLVTGSVSRSSDRLRVAVRMTDALTGVQLASETIEQPVGDLLALRDRLSAEVARLLRIRLGEAIELRERRVAAADPEAWELLLRAESVREQMRRLLGEDSLTARTLAREADSLLRAAERLAPEWPDPTILRGWLAYDLAGQAARPSSGAAEGEASTDWIAAGIRHADAALRINPDDPGALELRGALRYRGWAMATLAGIRDTGDMLGRAERDLRATVAAPSRYQARALSTLSAVLHFAGKLTEANLAAARAYEADAYLAGADAIVLRLFDTSLELQRYEDAADWCEQGRRTFPVNWRFRMCRLSLMAWSPGVRPDMREAWNVLAQLDSLTTPDERPWLRPQMTMIVAAVAGAAGLRDSAERIIAGARAAGTGYPDLLYYEALARVRLGQRARAAGLLADLLRRTPNIGPFLRGHREFEALWSDPRLSDQARPRVGLAP